MKRAILLAFVMVCAVGGMADDVKAEQCKADLAYWEAEGTSAIAHQRAPLDHLSVREINKRQDELATCMLVDHERWREYMKESENNISIVGTRYMFFIQRHNLMNQFLAEDDAGQGRGAPERGAQ